MSQSRNPKLGENLKDLTEKEFDQWLDLIPNLTDEQFNKLCNEVFAETMEREQSDIMDPPSYDSDDIPWDDKYDGSL